MNSTNSQVHLGKFLEFVRDHSMIAWISGDSIMAEAVYTKDGQTFVQNEKIGKTLTEIKNWLGY